MKLILRASWCVICSNLVFNNFTIESSNSRWFSQIHKLFLHFWFYITIIIVVVIAIPDTSIILIVIVIIIYLWLWNSKPLPLWFYLEKPTGACNTALTPNTHTRKSYNKLCTGFPKEIIVIGKYWTHNLCLERHISLIKGGLTCVLPYICFLLFRCDRLGKPTSSYFSTQAQWCCWN